MWILLNWVFSAAIFQVLNYPNCMMVIILRTLKKENSQNLYLGCFSVIFKGGNSVFGWLKIKIISYFFDSYFVKNEKVSKISLKTLKVFMFECHHPSTV